MAVETELKLSLASHDRRRVSGLAVVREWAAGRAVRRRLYSIYYDTPDLDLFQRGVSLRVRKVGRKWIQTVKTRGKRGHGLHTRGEFESIVRRQEPDFDAILALGGPRLFNRRLLTSRLVPVFETDFWRTAWTLVVPEGAQVEFALDSGEVRANGKTQALCELEIELKYGATRSLFTIAERVAGSVNVRPEDVNKAQRGYDLLRETAPTPVKAAALALRRKMSVDEALEASLWNCLDQLQANAHPVMASDDPEGVHQMRVGFRRFRACLTVYGGFISTPERKELAREMRWFLDLLGPARDWDVFITEHLLPLTSQVPDDHPVCSLLARAEKVRRRHYGALRDAIGSIRYGQLVLTMSAWVADRRWSYGLDEQAGLALNGKIVKTARQILSDRHRRAQKYRKRDKTLSDEEMHRLRIQIKKQRYAIEFMAGLYPAASVERFRHALKALQDVLGRINDAATSSRLLDEMEIDVLDPARAFVEGWYARARIADIGRFGQAWRSLKKKKIFWL